MTGVRSGSYGSPQEQGHTRTFGGAGISKILCLHGPPSSIKNIKNDLLQLHWYKDKYLNIIYSNMFLDLKDRFFLLILKEIKTYLWAPQRLLGRQ